MFRFTSFLTLLCTILIHPVQAQEYLWPTNSGTYLSSTFGETRSAHFHAGLDIKTWGREGYEVYATRDGFVHRLQVTERGYGKVVYLRHSDGSYSVYAHLQRFNEAFQAYVDSIRMLDHSFETEIYTDSLNWEIKQGQVIGFTGSSGVGPPHLHFELRDSLEHPFNALTTNLKVTDNLTPIIPSLIIEPLSSASRINGKPYAQTLTTVKVNGIYDFGSVRLTGKAGLAVNTYDMADDVYNRYAVYRLSLIQNGDTLFHEQLDTFSYEDEGSNMYLDRIAPFGTSNRGHQRLYLKDGAHIPFYRIIMPASVIEAADTATTYIIKASDYFGNTSLAKITILKDSSALHKKPALGNDPAEWYWHENWASPDLENTLDLVDLSIGNSWINYPIITEDLNTYIKSNRSDENNHAKVKLIFIEDKLPHVFARLYPGALQTVSTTDHRLTIRIGPQTLFDTLTTALHYTLEDDKAYLSIQPKMLPLRNEYKLEFYLPDRFPTGNYRLFRINDSGRPVYVKSTLIGRTVHGWTSDLGEFVIMTDEIAPSAWDFKVYKTDYGKWQASVKVNDVLSGIDSGRSEFSINHVRGIAEYDYEEKLLIYHLPGFIPQNKNTAHILLSDRAGNIRAFHFEK